MSLRSSLTALVAAFAIFSLGACDTTDDTALDVSVVDLSFDVDDYTAGGDLRTATFDAINASVSRGNLDFALEQAGDGALVMLYIDVELVTPVNGAEDGTTWSALPITRGFNEALFGNPDNPSDEDLITTLLVSYEYSFDNQDLYFDVVSSLPASSFPGITTREYFDGILPFRELGGSDRIDLRLVVIPDELFFVDGRAGARIDMRDYAAVKAAFNLPD